MRALPWKSGASAPRKAFRVVRASAQLVAFLATREAFFRALPVLAIAIGTRSELLGVDY